jgi:hypothetical protein
MSDPQADPLEQWRKMRDAYMDTWAKAMGEAVNSESYSQANGAMLQTILDTTAPLRDAQKKIMISALEQLNMPSRADFVSLAERLANLELLLDDMAAKLNEVHLLASRNVSQTAPPPTAKKATPKASRVRSVKNVSAARKKAAKTAKKKA